MQFREKKVGFYSTKQFGDELSYDSNEPASGRQMNVCSTS
jgi:hypothetical protein